ncbi:MAG TPA: radical SAM protein [Bryobacteraceae bacterium]|nr:radical SAM protein [Bryobacteraceae bacterium]
MHELRACSVCGNAQIEARLDIALGENQGLVVEALPGSWCWNCRSGTLPDFGAQLRDRLRRFDSIGSEGDVSPSLLYETPSHPASVQFEVTTRCNLRCSYCTHRYLDDKSDVPLPRFMRLLDRIDFDQVDNVDFTGLGEASLHPDLPIMMREIKRRGRPSHIRIVTNGVSITPKRFQALCEAGVTSIAFSIDSLDPGRFAVQRGGAKLSIVLGNLRLLTEYRRKEKLSGLQIKIKSVLIGDPYGEAERLLRFSAELGIDMPHFSCLDTREAVRPRYTESWMQQTWNTDSSALFLLWAERRWAELTGSQPESQYRGPTPAEQVAGYLNPALIPRELCRWAVDAAFIAGTGRCLSCCEQMIDIPRAEYGSLDDKPLSTLWSEDLFWGVRLPLSLGLLPRGCVGCPRAPAEGVPLDRLIVLS